MRAGADTFGKLIELMESEAGLRSVRNLGLKSAEEIRQVFFDCCYQELSEAERASFWQEALDAGAEKKPAHTIGQAMDHSNLSTEMEVFISFYGSDAAPCHSSAI